MTSFYIGQTVYASETTSGMVMIESSVDAVTMFTESVTSRSNLAANIVVVAAVGAEQAITYAMTIFRSSPNGIIENSTAVGMITSRSPMAM